MVVNPPLLGRVALLDDLLFDEGDFAVSRGGGELTPLLFGDRFIFLRGNETVFVTNTNDGYLSSGEIGPGE